MALSGRVKVPLPLSGIIVSHNPKRPYVYRVLRTYRNAKGQPTNDCRSIGRLDAATGLLIPNDYYWQAYPAAVETLPEPDAVRSIGASFLVGKVLERLGVAGIVEETLGEVRGRAVLEVAAYMARRGNVIDGIADWCQTSTLKGTCKLTSRSVSALFASVTFSEKMEFFRAWAARQQGPTYLAYDVTSVSTYSEGIGDAEWGHNRDKDALPQVNLGCYVDQGSGLPVFYVTYPGSVNDKAHLASMMAYNEDLGVKEVTFVLDRGFASVANLAALRSAKDNSLHYILGVASGYKPAREAVDKVRAGISDMGNRLGDGVYGQAVKSRFWGATGTLCVYWSAALCEERRSGLRRRIDKQAAELAGLEQLTKRQAKAYAAHFNIHLADDGSFTFTEDMSKIRAAALDTGFFCLLTDTDLTCAEVLSIYRRRDAIEKAFDDLKNHLDMKRFRTHRDDTTDGKMFCAFLALIAVSQIQAKVMPALKKSKQSISKRGVLTEMDKIKTVDAVSGQRLINPATKTQRQILEALGLTENDLKSYATKT